MQTRVKVIDTAVLVHCMNHPARVEPWTVRELAARVNWGRAALGHLRSGERDTLPVPVALAIAEAVGVHPNVLFTPPLSTNPDDRNPTT